MLGVSDLSLVPSQLFDQLQVIKSGSSADYGNGAITGAIDLSNSELQQQDNPVALEVNIGAGSYGLRQGGLNLNINKKKWQSTTRLYTASSENDFPYVLDSGQTRNNTHANFNTKAWLQSLSYQLKSNQKISFQSWVQRTFREIPPTTTQNISEAVQEDKINRFILDYEVNNKSYALKTQIAFFDENNSYEDPQILINNQNKFHRIISKTKFSSELSNNCIISGLAEISNTKGQSESYEDTESLTNYALSGSIKKIWSSSHLKLSIRQARNSLGNSFLSPSLLFNQDISPLWNLQAKVSREYRFPTLNELFWRPGGNSDLLSEHGWNQELDLRCNKPESPNIRMSIYHRLINDWILWSPIDDTFFYGPFNISKVRSYGTELQVNHSLNLGSLTVDLNTAYSYTISQNLTTIKTPQINAGDQLFYIPRHQLIAGITNTYKNITLTINGAYLSSTEGIIETLDGYTLINAYLYYDMDLSSHAIQLSVGINNMTDTNYRIIERRPMMGRNVSVNIKYKI